MIADSEEMAQQNHTKTTQPNPADRPPCGNPSRRLKIPETNSTKPRRPWHNKADLASGKQLRADATRFARIPQRSATPADRMRMEML
jgi:hypothetical protein